VDASQLIVDRFGDISERCGESARPTHLPECDKIIWYVVATRCEMDMEGFESIFDQLLTEDELLYLIASLDELREPAMAEAFRRAHSALRRVGFYDRPDRMCHEFGPELEAELAEVEAFFDSDQKLWSLDQKLAALIA